MPEQTAAAGTAQLVGRNVGGEQPEGTFGGEVEGLLDAGVDGGERGVQARQAPGLLADEVAPAAGENAQLDGGLLVGLDAAQIPAQTDLLGDDPSVARIGLVLAARQALARPVDREAGDVDQAEDGSEQQGLREGSEAAADIEADEIGHASCRERVCQNG